MRYVMRLSWRHPIARDADKVFAGMESSVPFLAIATALCCIFGRCGRRQCRHREVLVIRKSSGGSSAPSTGQ